MRADLEMRMTVEEFLSWLETQPERPRYELIAGEPIEMPAERVRHAKIKNEVWLALRDAVRAAGVDYTALGDGVVVRIDHHTVYEPDASVAANGSLDDDSMFAPEPVIMVEVLSPSTAMRDASVKLEDYFRVPTIAHYLVIDPERRTVLHHRRFGDRIETGIFREGRMRLEPPGIEVGVRQFF